MTTFFYNKEVVKVICFCTSLRFNKCRRVSPSIDNSNINNVRRNLALHEQPIWAERKATVPLPSLWFDETGMCHSDTHEWLHSWLYQHPEDIEEISKNAQKHFSTEMWKAMLKQFEEAMIEEMIEECKNQENT